MVGGAAEGAQLKVKEVVDISVHTHSAYVG
jgi:hypothetical protein